MGSSCWQRSHFMNVLQCASATCFCHRFAMLSCLNLIGWRAWGGGAWGEGGQEDEDVVNDHVMKSGQVDKVLVSLLFFLLSTRFTFSPAQY